ncbi:MAG: transglycosylase domain-containing protein [Rhodopseudomonas palustris]|nr:transglycosylase domain-containing protein [Rhodopseudomonas palustris]
MAWRWLTGAPVTRQWIDLERMAPSLPSTVAGGRGLRQVLRVIMGIDWDALREVIDDFQDGEARRGGSSITQQLAKNLFLWPGRSVPRKGLEVAAGAADRSGAVQAAASWNRISTSPNGGRMASSGSGGGRAHVRHAGREISARARRRCSRRSCPISVTRSAKNPGRGVRGGWPRLYQARGQSAELSRRWRQPRRLDPGPVRAPPWRRRKAAVIF